MTTTMAVGRRQVHAKNSRLEAELVELGRLLGPAEELALEGHTRPQQPVTLVVGGPRSGSTLTMQVLAATGTFAYPTNLLSRFFAAPAIGARIQALLVDERFDFRGELADIGQPLTFESDLGKSSGALQPNEFWYFWRRFFPIQEPRRLAPAELDRVDGAGFLAGLAGIEHALAKPLVMKGMLLQQNLPFLTDLLDRVVYVDVRRHPMFQCQSILEARRNFFGDIDRWYSVKPPEYDWLKDRNPYEQIAGQVLHNRRHLEAGLADAGPERTIVRAYDAFCADPGALYEELATKLAALGADVERRYAGPATFENRDRIRIDEREWVAVNDAWTALGGEPLPEIDGGR